MNLKRVGLWFVMWFFSTFSFIKKCNYYLRFVVRPSDIQQINSRNFQEINLKRRPAKIWIGTERDSFFLLKITTKTLFDKFNCNHKHLTFHMNVNLNNISCYAIYRNLGIRMDFMRYLDLIRCTFMHSINFVIMCH